MGNLAAKTENVICFFIDEIQYMKDDEMEALVNALHRVNQLRLPIIIFGAGLPKVLKILGEVKSYAERLFKYIEVAELSNDAAREAICRPAEDFSVTYTDEAVNEILNWTKGYPFFIQEFCSIIWENTDTKRIEWQDVNILIPLF